MTTDEDKLRQLIENQKYNLVTATAYVEAAGVCTFCHEDVFASPSGFWSAQIDHLLPRSRYPELEWEPLNCVYSCFRCNQLKAGFDPLDDLKARGVDIGEPFRLLRERRSEIISIVQSRLSPLRTTDRSTFETTVTLLRSAETAHE